MYSSIQVIEWVAITVGGSASSIAIKSSGFVSSFVHKNAGPIFCSLVAFKNIPLLVGTYTYMTTQPTAIVEKPKFVAEDVTVIIPTTFNTPHALVACIRRIMLNKPAAVYVVTAQAHAELVNALLFETVMFGPEVQTLFVTKLNKRSQILRAMPHVKTPITVLADDDVFWPEDFLKYMLAVFDDDRVGAGGPRQRVRREVHTNMSARIWNMLGIAYLERRVFNNCATNAIDGSISTLSGRTAAFRTRILRGNSFEHYFTHDSWRGRPLNSDDDKCLTRWVYRQGWQIRLQFDPRCTIETTVEGDRKYLDQCLRWARAHWRGNLTVMKNESYWRSLKYLWGFFYIYLGQYRTPTMLIDGLQLYFLSVWMAQGFSHSTALYCYVALVAWILFSKNLKMIPHYCKYPQDLWFVPISVAFSYFHGFLNVYALCTMTKTHWGSQKLEMINAQG